MAPFQTLGSYHPLGDGRACRRRRRGRDEADANALLAKRGRYDDMTVHRDSFGRH
jgi:hypothetical protein